REVGAHQIGAAQADVHIEHIGAHIDDAGGVSGGAGGGRGGGGIRGRRGNHRHVAGVCGRGNGGRTGGRRRAINRGGHFGGQRVVALLLFQRLALRLLDGRVPRAEFADPDLHIDQQDQRQADPQESTRIFHGTG